MFPLLLAFAVAPPVPPRLDALGDALPDGALLRIGTRRWWLPYTSGPIAYAPGGRWIATGEGDAVVLIDARTGWRAATFPLPEGVSAMYCRTLRLCFAPDGRTLYATNDGRLACAFDVPGGRVARTFDHADEKVTDIAASDDGTELVTVSWARSATFVTRWSPGGKRLGRISLPEWDSPTLSPRGDRFTYHTQVGEKTLVRVVATGSGKTLLEREGRGDAGTTLSLSPDGRTAVTSTYEGKELVRRAIDVETGRTLYRLDDTFSPAFRPDSRALVASAGGDAGLLEARTGKMLRRLPGFSRLSVVAFSDDGRTVLSTGWGRLRLTDAATGKTLTPGDADAPIRGLALSADGSALRLEDWDESARTVRLADGKPARPFTARADERALSPDGKLFAEATHSYVRLYEVGPGREVRRELRPVRADPEGVEHLSFTPDGRRLVTAGGPVAMVWDVSALASTACRLPAPAWRAAWERLGGDEKEQEVAASVELHAALEQTLAEMPRVISHDATPENARRAKAGRELLRRIGTPAARALLARLKASPEGSPWSKE